MLTEVALARVDLGQLSPTRHLLRKQEKPIRKPQPNRLGQSSVRETCLCAWTNELYTRKWAAPRRFAKKARSVSQMRMPKSSGGEGGASAKGFVRTLGA